MTIERPCLTRVKTGPIGFSGFFRMYTVPRERQGLWSMKIDSISYKFSKSKADKGTLSKRRINCVFLTHVSISSQVRERERGRGVSEQTSG